MSLTTLSAELEPTIDHHLLPRPLGRAAPLPVSARCMFASLFVSASLQSSLPWSEVNLLIVTDVHSWVAGHAHTDSTPALDADYGAVLSLYEQLAATAAKAGHDLFFVQNGDLNDGTGLSRVPPAALLPLIRKMPFDALTTVLRIGACA